MIDGWDVDFLYRGFLISLRLGTLLFFVPIFSGSSVPMMFKAGMILVFTNLVAMIVPERPTFPAHVAGLLVAGLHEVLLGLFMGLIVKVAFQTVAMGGEIISIQGGFMRDASFNPNTQLSGPSVQRLLAQTAIVVFLVTGMHLEVFASFVKSFDVAHLGTWVPTGATVSALIAQTAQIFVLAVQIAAPFIALNFVVNAIFAVLGKTVPQMNVFIVSFSIMIVAGFLGLIFTLDVIVQYIMTLLRDSAFNLLHLLDVR